MKKIFLRHRWLFLVVGSLAAFGLSLYSDPEHGVSTALGVTGMFQGIWAVAAAHYSRKWVVDYPEANQRMLFAKAAESSIGAGLALVALAIVLLAFALIFSPRAHAAEIPAGFYKYGSQLKAEQQHYWKDHPSPYLLAGLVEQESCVSVKSKQCWSASARLKTAREEGASFGQITRAYRADGSLRFDALAELRAQYRNELGEWSWGNVYTRPDLSFRGIVLMSRDAAKSFSGAPDMLALGDASYNSGKVNVQKARRACALTRGCNPGLWFANVERHCMAGHQPLYGGRSACEITIEHVRNVILVRAPKYKQAWATL